MDEDRWAAATALRHEDSGRVIPPGEAGRRNCSNSKNKFVSPEFAEIRFRAEPKRPPNPAPFRRVIVRACNTRE
jgi:hypothetical protein